MQSSMNSLILVSLAIILSFISPVQAAGWDAGDTIALLLGLVVGFVALFAFLGWWARRKGEV